MNDSISQTSMVITTTTSLCDASWIGLAGSYGAAISITATGSLELEDSELKDNSASGFGGAIFAQGALTLKGEVDFTGNTASGGGGAICATKKLIVTGGTFSGNAANTGGAVDIQSDAELADVIFDGNQAAYGGALRIVSGKTVVKGATFTQNSAVQIGGAIHNYATLTIENSLFRGNSSYNGGALYNDDGSTATLKNVAFLTASDTIINDGTMLLQGTISLAGTLTTNSAIDATGVSLIFDISSHAAGNATAIVGNLTQLTGVADYALAVTEDQAAGTYALAGSAAGFDASIDLQCGGFESLALSAGNTVTYHNSVYTLGTAGGTLSATVADFATEASAEALAWASINGASSYALELSCGTQTLALNLDSENAELLGIANGNYTWQVRNSAEEDNWQTGQAFSQTDALEGPQELAATATEATALFFAKTDGLWNDDYFALNTLTGETAQLAGKARLTDIFTGGEGASILLLDAFASSTQPILEAKASGVAFFLDDIYSAAPGSAERSRLSNIDTIIASNGDDIVDLTSERYDLAGSVTILGGKGDDIIWANSGDDILSGGAGDDTLLGGGGNDIFCFGEKWGEDTIGQLAGDGNSATLWFSQSNETLNLSFVADGSDTLITAATGDSIRAVGMSVTIDDCRFGAAEGYVTQYNALASFGAFV